MQLVSPVPISQCKGKDCRHHGLPPPGSPLSPLFGSHWTRREPSVWGVTCQELHLEFCPQCNVSPPTQTTLDLLRSSLNLLSRWDVGEKKILNLQNVVKVIFCSQISAQSTTFQSPSIPFGVIVHLSLEIQLTIRLFASDFSPKSHIGRVLRVSPFLFSHKVANLDVTYSFMSYTTSNFLNRFRRESRNRYTHKQDSADPVF